METAGAAALIAMFLWKTVTTRAPPNAPQRPWRSCFQNLFAASSAARTDEVIEWGGAMFAIGGITDIADVISEGIPH